MNADYAMSDAELAASADGRPLFTYVFRPVMPPDHAPRPYFHPIFTRSGERLTAIQPPDHPWHYGLSLAVPQVDGVNFWGGGTYVSGHGYLDRADHGQVVHRAWPSERVERLDWLDPHGGLLLSETRTVEAQVLSAEAWRLDLTFTLTNATDRTLAFASPAVAGREGAGYGGLFWRGAPALRGWTVAADNVTGEASVHGRPAPALDWSDPGSGAGIRFFDCPSNPGYPARWFVRLDDYPGVCFPLAFSEPYVLAADAALRLTYALTIRDREA